MFEYEQFTTHTSTASFEILFLNMNLAFVLNIASLLVLIKTSSLVLSLCGILKDIILVGLSMLIFGNPVTFMQFSGFGLSLVGLFVYKRNIQLLSPKITHKIENLFRMPPL